MSLFLSLIFKYGWKVVKSTFITIIKMTISIKNFLNLDAMFRINLSKIINWLKQPTIDQNLCRVTFNELSLPKAKPKRKHTHGVSAALRDATTSFVDTYSELIGCIPYYYQMSRHDQSVLREGSRSYYWSKDIPVQPRDFEPTDLVTIIDTDFYIDMPLLLAKNVRPYLISTCQPGAVSESTGEYSFTFDANSEMHYRVSGGGYYHHKIWNYGLDNVVVYKTLFGIPYGCAAYLVDKKQLDKHHQLILLTPIGYWGVIGSLLFSFIGGATLKYVDIVRGNFLRLEIVNSDGTFRSTGVVNSFNECTVTAAIDDTIASIGRTSKIDLTNPQVMSLSDEISRVGSSALLEYHRAMIGRKCDVLFPVQQSINAYQFKPSQYDPEAKCTMIPFMHPFVPGAFAPDVTKHNEEVCIDERVQKVKTDRSVSVEMFKLMKEFCHHFIPVQHTLIPCDDEFVHEQQDRPSQRRIIEESSFMTVVHRVINMFMKKETYFDYKPPRPISVINGVDKVQYSKYIYSLSKGVLNVMPWYAFGKKPVEIARRVAHICSNAQMVCSTDFSKFDGHVTEALRMFERMILLRAFRKEYHADVSRLHKSQYGMHGIGYFGTHYEQDYARASGSPETSCLNSIDNAFMAYVALRQHLTPDEAWNSLGIYGGDDGLTPDVNADYYVKMCDVLGQVLTVEPVFRGQPGVKFLARQYSPNVWFGDDNSCCDLFRQLQKIHTSVRLPPDATPDKKLLEKCRCYWLSDRNTPIIGDFSDVVLKLGGVSDPSKAILNYSSLRTWWADIPTEQQFPNRKASWMLSYLDKCFPGIDVHRFEKWLARCSCLADCLKPPMLFDPILPKPKENLVSNGELITVPLTKLVVKEEPTTLSAGFKSQTYSKRRERLKQKLRSYKV